MVAKEAAPMLSRSIVLEDVKEAMSTELVEQRILQKRSIVEITHSHTTYVDGD